MPTTHQPATKADIERLWEAITQLADASLRGKNEVIEETKEHFDFALVALRGAVLSPQYRRMSQHEERIDRLEQYVGVR
jgi:hypothetical protein